MANGTLSPTAGDVNTAAPALGAPDSAIGQRTGTESALSTWAGPYVTEMLGQGQAVANQPYQAYTGPLTAGESAPQSTAFQGVANLAVPTAAAGTYTPETFDTAQANRYINPYVQAALQPQLVELQRQQELKRIENAGRLTRAGAFGGGRQAVMESELDRSYLDKSSELTGLAYLDAFNKAQQQFNVEQGREQSAQTDANRFVMDALSKQAQLGGLQRDIEKEGVAADMKQFEEERKFPYQQVQFQQSLLQNLPLETQSYSYAQPSALANILSGASGSSSYLESILGPGGIGGLVSGLFGSDNSTPSAVNPSLGNTSGIGEFTFA
tara:strand:- start:1340 stop:2314 length:975 start_codon:yes stop_codon:yes gene_type:complete